MLNILNAALHGSMALLTASIIGVLPPILQLQNELPAIDNNPAAITIAPEQPLQNKFLPEVHLSMDEVIATTSIKSSAKETAPIVLSLPDVRLKFPPLPKPPPPSLTKKTQRAPAAIRQSSAPVISAPVKVLTPQDVLNATTFTLNQRIDGQYIVILHARTSGYSADWGFADSTIGGTASVPKMNMSYSCDPQWNPAPYNSADQNPTFDIATSYSCSISMTDALLRTASKTISFQTGAGRLFVTSSNLDTLLKSGSDENGFVFDNQSGSKIMISSLTFDVYFKSLNVSSPIIIRFVNPDDSSSYVDFPVQNLPADVSDPAAKSATGMQESSFSFSINPHSQRLLTVQLFGIQQLMTIGVNPEFKIMLRQITTDNPSLKTTLFSPSISWSCIPFDPMNSISSIPTDQNCR
ncbi:MAG TPA: hypothetical protein VMV71_02265 [Candidatus Paceibacterota bacterium]|nr:hypothetical protein [Candidatus Paceibacterota bacterium]